MGIIFLLIKSLFDPDMAVWRFMDCKIIVCESEQAQCGYHLRFSRGMGIMSIVNLSSVYFQLIGLLSSYSFDGEVRARSKF